MSDAVPNAAPKAAPSGNKFGTFGGVFTPSILTILGAIMFLRTGYAVGTAGVWGAVGILVLANSITFLTGLSIYAISTNTRVRGGGAYFLISRSLGPGYGGAIGVKCRATCATRRCRSHGAPSPRSPSGSSCTSRRSC